MTQVLRNLRLPSEWESDGGVLLSWPHAATDWSSMLEEVTDCFKRITRAIVKDAIALIVAPDIELPKSQLAGLDQGRIIYHKVDTDDTWARDFGPITTVGDDGAWLVNDFKFNGWGLKFRACNDNLVTRSLVDAGKLKGEYVNRLGFVLEGGSIESDGQGVLMTTKECMLSPNRNGNLSQEQIEQYLSRAFGLKKILWLENGSLAGDDTDGHIDTLARFAPNDTILYTGTDDQEDWHYQGLHMMEEQLVGFTTLQGKPFNLARLPLPDPIYDEQGERLPATYANFLVLKSSVLMPVYGQPQKDRLAAQTICRAFPGREVVEIDCRALIKQHGSLHCVTMQLPKAILPI